MSRKARQEELEAVEAALAADREAALRDMFAASALGTLILRSGDWMSERDMAARSYDYADAMIEARKRKP